MTIPLLAWLQVLPADYVLVEKPHSPRLLQRAVRVRVQSVAGLLRVELLAVQLFYAESPEGSVLQVFAVTANLLSE